MCSQLNQIDQDIRGNNLNVGRQRLKGTIGDHGQSELVESDWKSVLEDVQFTEISRDLCIDLDEIRARSGGAVGDCPPSSHDHRWMTDEVNC